MKERKCEGIQKINSIKDKKNERRDGYIKAERVP